MCSVTAWLEPVSGEQTIWKKRIEPADEGLWEERLTVSVPGRFVILNQRGKKRLGVQVFPETPNEGEQLLKQYGGTIETLSEDVWSEAPPGPPSLVKIRDALVLTSGADGEGLVNMRKRFPGRHVLSVPAELAFGTGEHETTSTCLRMLVDEARRRSKLVHVPWRCLDLGTGTGVLAMAARALGASEAQGWENDRLALDVAERNCKRNGFDSRQVAFRNVDVLQWEPERGEWDVVMANMFSEVLIAIFPRIRRALKRNGTLVISGILREQEAETLEAAASEGLEMKDVKRVGKWVTACHHC